MGAARIYSYIDILPQHDGNRVATFCKDLQKQPHFQCKSERRKENIALKKKNLFRLILTVMASDKNYLYEKKEKYKRKRKI